MEFSSVNRLVCYFGLREISLFMFQIGDNERVYKSDWMCQSSQCPRFSQLLMEMSIPLALYGLSTSLIIHITPCRCTSTSALSVNIRIGVHAACSLRYMSSVHGTNNGTGIRIPLGPKMSLRVLANFPYFMFKRRLIIQCACAYSCFCPQ